MFRSAFNHFSLKNWDGGGEDREAAAAVVVVVGSGRGLVPDLLPSITMPPVLGLILQ